jgi:(2Fe-2S) ferredoxin
MIITPGKEDRRPTALVICVNLRYGVDRPSCAGRGSEALADALERAIGERRIDVAVERIRCFGDCARGPSMRLYPAGPFYRQVGTGDLEAILADIERLCGRRDGAPPPTLPIHLLGS